MSLEERFAALTPRYPEFKGQAAVVTGGAKGIGLGIVLRLAREGMRVVVADIDERSLAETESDLGRIGVEVLAFHGDMSKSAAISRLFETVQQTFGGVQLLVNNAADLARTRLLDPHEALLEHQLATNIRGPYLCSYHAAKMMSASGGGNIIHITSVGALRVHWKAFPYDVTKGAINTMTKAMAVDLAEYNIRVNAIGPGVTQKEKTAAPTRWLNPEIIGRIPMQRAGSAADTAAAVAFLASTDAGYVTGQVIYVDGGITAQLSPPGQLL